MANLQTDKSLIIEQFEKNTGVYDAFRLSAEAALRELIRLESIQIHSVTSRTKTRESLAEKIIRDGKEPYENIGDVTDIVGIRIITHIEDDVDKIGELIKREFLIDEENSVDKRQKLDPDRFGYLSLHYVCFFSKERTSIAENRRFEKLKFEVQVRSILQHAWAEIEHDLGYKTGSTIPANMRRRFSRLAGLLEIADNEFRRLRDDLTVYGNEVKQRIAAGPSLVELNDVSLDSFISSNKAIRSLDEKMASCLKTKIIDKPYRDLAGQLISLGISTIEELSTAIDKYGSIVFSQWLKRINETPDREGTISIKRGISVFHLCQVLSVEKGGAKKLHETFKISSRNINHRRCEHLSRIINEELEKARGVDS